jgi:hypothetical protein
MHNIKTLLYNTKNEEKKQKLLVQIFFNWSSSAPRSVRYGVRSHKLSNCHRMGDQKLLS